MATFVQRVNELATRMGTECKTLHDKIGTLTSLTTTQKASLVAAINEIQSGLSGLNSTVGGHTTSISDLTTKYNDLKSAVEAISVSDVIDDDASTSTTTTYSASKIESQITAAKQAVKDDLVNGAGDAYDTLKELADLIATNKDAIEALKTLAAGHVKYDGAQELTDEQKTQARSNIGAASATNLTTFQNAVGETDTNFVTTFETALAGTSASE